MRSLSALHEYNQAADVGEKFLTEQTNPQLYLQLLSVHSELNDAKRVNQLFSTMSRFVDTMNFTTEDSIALYKGVGNGFLNSGNISEARRWLTRAVDQFGKRDEFIYLLSLCQQSIKNVYTFHYNLNGGYLDYSYPQRTIFDHGWYRSLSIGLLYTGVHKISFSYAFTGLAFNAQFQLRNLWQNEFRLYYDNYYSFLNKTHLYAILEHSSSNMLFAHTVYAAGCGGLRIGNPLQVGGSVFSTFTETYRFIQISPVCAVKKCFLEASVECNVIDKLSAAAEQDSLKHKKWQFSYTGRIASSCTYGSVSFSYMRGDRAFLHEDGGAVFQNTTEPFSYGMKIVLQITPIRANPFAVYYIFKTSKYRSYTSNVTIGGLFITW